MQNIVLKLFHNDSKKFIHITYDIFKPHILKD